MTGVLHHGVTDDAGTGKFRGAVITAVLHFPVMGTTLIKRVTPVRDAVDRLDWQVAVTTDFYGTEANQAFVFNWEGSVALYREGVAPGGGQQPGKLALEARWLNRETVARIHLPREMLFDFSTDLPGGALDRIELLRGGGRLYARLEGKLFIVLKSGGNFAQNPPRPWVDDAVALMGDFHRTPIATVVSDRFELTRDLWCTEVLAALRPPGRFVMEIQVPSATADGEVATRALAHLDDARRTFDEGGRDGEVGRICYRALDELRKLADRIDERYGKFARDRLLAQIKETKSLCDPERHGDSPHHDDLKFDRPLAQHVLAVTSSLAGVLLR